MEIQAIFPGAETLPDFTFGRGRYTSTDEEYTLTDQEVCDEAYHEQDLLIAQSENVNSRWRRLIWRIKEAARNFIWRIKRSSKEVYTGQ